MYLISPAFAGPDPSDDGLRVTGTREGMIAVAENGLSTVISGVAHGIHGPVLYTSTAAVTILGLASGNGNIETRNNASPRIKEEK
jgi:hypothetical protein